MIAEHRIFFKRAEDAEQPVGRYGRFSNEGTPRTETSDVLCPYCQAPLIEVFAIGTGRVLNKVCDAEPSWARVLVEFIPDSHRSLKCEHCRQCFTTLKERTRDGENASRDC